MIYMDADIQVLANIDNLFDLPSGCFYAMMDCLCEMGGQTCQQMVSCPQELGESPPFYLNCGMFLFEPCLDTYARLLSTLDVTPPTLFAEQVKYAGCFLNELKISTHAFLSSSICRISLTCSSRTARSQSIRSTTCWWQ